MMKTKQKSRNMLSFSGKFMLIAVENKPINKRERRMKSPEISGK